MQMENCVVCLVQFSQNDIFLVKFTDEDSRNRDKISWVYRKILRIFCKYFNLPCKQNENDNDGENQEENDILSSFPFCLECRNLVAELCIFHEKSESIHKIIQNTIAKITMKIVQTEEKDQENFSNSDSLDNRRNGQKTRKKMKHEYRRQILQNFNPRVLLTDCQSQNPNQEKIPKETANTNQVYSTPINLEDQSPLNDGDSHGNSNGNDKDDLTQEDGRDQNYPNEEISANSSVDSQETEKQKEKNSSLNLPSIPVDKNSVREETRESLMQQIRTKFNSQPQDFQPLENSTPEKKSQKKIQPSDSKQRRSDEPQNGRVLKKAGNGKFRFFNNWTFDRVELGFKCGHCPKIYTKINSIIQHMKLWHVTGKFKCPKCPRSFLARSLLKQHSCGWNLQAKSRCLEISPGSGKFIYNGKKQNWDFQLIDGKFHCLTCPAFRRKKVHLINHLRDYHDALTTNMCEECGKMFTLKSDLFRHKLTHLKNKAQGEGKTQKHQHLPKPKTPSVCPHCQKTCKSKTGLGIHIFRRHKDIVMTTTKITEEEKRQENSGSLKYPCGKCTRIFTSPVFLKNHEKFHDVLLDCPKCKKKFKSREELQIHLDRHNKVFEFFCDVCNKGFLQKWQVTRHKETGAHSQKEETVKSKEASAHFISVAKANAKKSKRKRKVQGESESSEEEEESGPEHETDENESQSSEAATTEEEEN